MRKNTLSKFIDRSKEVINTELKKERMETLPDSEIVELVKDYSLNDENLEMKSEIAKETKVEDLVEEKVVELSCSKIARDVFITGDIIAKGNLDLDCNIEGNIECDYELKTKGAIKGNIKAHSVSIGNNQIVGNILCDGDCEILHGASVQGDIEAENLILYGSVNGNVVVKGKIILHTTAVLNGNCTTSQIKIEEGAVIKGNIQTSSEE